MHNVFKGLLHGFYAWIGLVVLGFLIEFFNCGIAILACDLGRDFIFTWSYLWDLLILCGLGGGVIEGIYGILKDKQDYKTEGIYGMTSGNKQEDERIIAMDTYAKAEIARKKCEEIANNNNNNDVVAKYVSADVMKDVAEVLHDAVELEGVIDSLDKKVSEMEGKVR